MSIESLPTRYQPLQLISIRTNRPELFCKKDVLRNSAKFTGKHLCQSLFFNKVAGHLFLQNTSGGCLGKHLYQSLFLNKVAGHLFYRTPLVAASVLFKVGLSPLKNICVVCFIESPLEILKNTFYFILKAPLVLKILKFL